MVALDRTVLVALATITWSNSLPRSASSKNGAWVPVLALADAVWVLRSTYRRTAAELAAILERLLADERLTFQDGHVVRAAPVLFRARPALGFMDCLLLETARKSNQLPLATFDRRLATMLGAKRL